MFTYRFYAQYFPINVKLPQYFFNSLFSIKILIKLG